MTPGRPAPPLPHAALPVAQGRVPPDAPNVEAESRKEFESMAVIDADTHVDECEETWRYMPP